MKSRMIQCAAILFFSSFYSTALLAGGFQTWEQDASGIGDYHSGAAAEALNAGTQYYNPAGMSNLTKPEISAGVVYIPLNITYTGTIGSDLTVPAITANSNTDNYLPNFYVIYPVNKRLALGFSVTVPFGASTEYPMDNAIADAATTTKLQTINLNPSLAIRVSNYFSLGAGFDAVWTKATYDSAFIGVFPDNPPALNNDLSAWGYGWNAGALFYITPQTRLGVSYRSHVQLNGTGQSEYLDATAPVTTDDLTGTIQLPSTTIFSFYTDLTSKWALLFSAFYTNWKVFSDLDLQNVLVLGNPTEISVHEDYVNSWNFALGAHYWILHNLMLKIGAGYDETPTQTGYRDVRLPDAPKYALSLGLHWDIIQSLAIDFGWIHFFVKNAIIDNAKAMTDDLVAQLTQANGISKTQVNVVGMQISWKI